MSDYTEDHASAYADIADAGAAVSFVGATTITGVAIRDKGRRGFRDGEAVSTESPVLFFAPTTIGDLPAQNASVVWGGFTYTVQAVEPIAPNGIAICAYVSLGR